MSPSPMRRLRCMATCAWSTNRAKPICIRKNSLSRSSYRSPFGGVCYKRPKRSLNPDASPAVLARRPLGAGQFLPFAARRARSISRYFQYGWNTKGLYPCTHGCTTWFSIRNTLGSMGM